MVYSRLNQTRDRIISIYTQLISIIGFSILTYQLLLIEELSFDPTFVILALFIFISEYYSVLIWRVSLSLSFPLVYTIVLLFELPVGIVTYGVLLFVVHLLKHRPPRMLFFIPAQQTISILSAAVLTEMIAFPGGLSQLGESLAKVSVFTLIYYFTNNLLVDGLLKFRGQKYKKGQWAQKNAAVSLSLLLSLAYLFTMLLLGSQNRGIIDFFSYLFFYSPLIAISVICSIIVRLQKERSRLRSMFSLTTELNRSLPSQEWRQKVASLFKEFIEVEATILMLKVDDEWLLNYKDGEVVSSYTPSRYDIDSFNSLKETKVFPDRKKEMIPADSAFNSHIRAFVCTPFIIDDEPAGMIMVGRSRTNSFSSGEARSMATFGNQMALFLKNYHLISEQQRRLLFEERNRIAREIHDGISQSVAGAVMKLETSQRLSETQPDKADKLTLNAIDQLRSSLKEIRQSIYALRPYPTDEKGLRQAIRDKIQTLQDGNEPEMTFRETGEIYPLPDSVQRVIFETVQESLHNVIKHANAEQVRIMLDYQSRGVTLTIQDDGTGFSLAEAMMKARQTPHYGILNINEQADKIGAALQIDSTVGKGTTITLDIPNYNAEEKML